ncbi:MAG: LysM peptidoglycan-binding domain-containing protein, partial [Acidobacteriota bacterium]
HGTGRDGEDGSVPAVLEEAMENASDPSGDDVQAGADPTLPDLQEAPSTAPPPPPPGPEALLQDALEAYESAEVFWEQGAFDDAFAALDHAYEAMAAVSAGDEPVLAQEKENLRHLISRRVVEIYASRQTAVGDPNGSIRVTLNDDVKREIESFQGPERDFFLDSYRRSGRYRPMILEQLRAAGLPEQLSWMPLVESGFKSRALSSARALGLWQFISSTGYRYGLERTAWVDERMDPEKATEAAIGYLTDLHNLFGDWMTALAAYNCGERSVLREIGNQRFSYFDRFWDLYARLPRETRRYVPRFLAVLAILEDPEAYGFHDLPEPLPRLEYDELPIERPLELATLERAAGLEEKVLAELNPELRSRATPDGTYSLRVPPGTGETVLASLEEAPEWEPPELRVAVHRVRPGETLSGIASRYRTSTQAIMNANGLRGAHRIWPGQQLRVPGAGAATAASGRQGGEVRHAVRRGDTLWQIASRYGTTVDRIRRANGLSGNVLHPGQTLTIHAGSSGGSVYVVRRGDTLGAIARREGVSLTRLLRANDLSRRSTIYPGQSIVIPR